MSHIDIIADQRSEQRMAEIVRRLASLNPARSAANEDSLALGGEIIAGAWRELGLEVWAQDFRVSRRTFRNLGVSFGPTEAPRFVVGAHYDVAGEQPGADDNASGIAGLIELARLLVERKPGLKKRVELVAYANEEPPFFGTADMGSAVHARSLRECKVPVEFMISLEMIGYYSDLEGSQAFPDPRMATIYPTKGNFIAVVGDERSDELVEEVREVMREQNGVGVESISGPRAIPGIGLSDHVSYWDQGFAALMLTDTAFFRNPHYHTKGDRPETLDYSKARAVVEAVYEVLMHYQKRDVPARR